jgi:hypothetical protein
LKEVASQWRLLSPNEKAFWEEKARQDRLRYVRGKVENNELLDFNILNLFLKYQLLLLSSKDGLHSNSRLSPQEKGEEASFGTKKTNVGIS